MFTSLLYIVWFGLAGFYFVVALWEWLERISGKKINRELADYLKQGVFVLICALLSVLLDKIFVANFSLNILSFEIPALFFQFLLFPFVLFFVGKLWGPTTEIKIEKISHVSKKTRKKK